MPYRLDQGVEVALHRAKVWSKYAKDVLSYVEKRTALEMEYSKNVAKLAQTMRCALKEDVSIRVCYGLFLSYQGCCWVIKGFVFSCLFILCYNVTV